MCLECFARHNGGERALGEGFVIRVVLGLGEGAGDGVYVVTSLRLTHIHRECTKGKTPGAYSILMHVASGLFFWSMAAGLLALSKSPICT